MNPLNTTSVSLAVTPTAVSTLFSHYIHKRLKDDPTVHLSYDEGLHLIRSFLEYASHHTVEELQGFTSQRVPSPHWVKLDTETVPEPCLARAAEAIQAQLGEDGIRRVGGRRWWQWRGPKAPLEAEWIEMRADAHERKKKGEPARRVMMYVHGGAYYFGSVDEHRYQMQRHARKLKARVLAPRYRLSPQFPFPCGLQDCLATYLHLLTMQDASTIVLAGDSAGGGMVLAMMCLLRDRGMPLPAGGVLISPWVDLTHSFPSVAGDAPLDYIPSSGFHHKPSRAWPPPNEDDLAVMQAEVERRGGHSTRRSELDTVEPPLTIRVNGELIILRDQIQLYTTNHLLSHPLVSTAMQPTLGGLPPLLILVGGGEILRDEQIYVAHKCADPAKYAPSLETMTEHDRELLAKYKPTDVQLQVWDDLCHVATTLSFTRPAKYMYRSIAQFGAWALARAQKKSVEAVNDSEISVVTSSSSDADAFPPVAEVGRAGDPLPPFKNHMIRQRVTRGGHVLPLPPEEDLPGCCVEPREIGVIKQGPVLKWLGMRKKYDHKYASARAKVHKKTVKDMLVGFHDFGPDEVPPPSALAGRIPVHAELHEALGRKKKSLGLALWSLWGSKHDEMAVVREQRAAAHEPREKSHEEADESTPIAQLLAMRREREALHEGSEEAEAETGVAGKRPFLDGIALPFSIRNEAATSSMITLHSDSSGSRSRPGSASSFRMMDWMDQDRWRHISADEGPANIEERGDA